MATILSKNTRRGQAEARESREAQERRFRTRRSWFVTEHMRQQANRYQMALDEAYYDGDQWLPDEAAAVRARGQNPVVFNEVKPLVDFMLGTERRSRVDFSVMNRSDASEEAWQDAQNKQALLKFIDDLNRTQFVRSDAADDQFKAGLGWLEIGVRADPTDYPIYKRRESWRNMLYDSLGTSRICEDWRYQFRFREVDFDIAEAMLTDRSKVDLLRRSIITADSRAHLDWLNSGSSLTQFGMTDTVGTVGKWTTYDAEAWLHNPRERVLLIECWSTEPYRDTTGQGAGLEDRILMRKRCSVMTEHDTLFESWSPYNHDMFPFIPLWCYRRKKDGAPYGMIRQQRGPQDSLNKHMSKAQFRISTRQVWKEVGALDDAVMDDDEFEDAVGDPSAVITLARGALSGGKVDVKEGMALAQSDIQLAERFALSIRNGAGVSQEDRGQDPANVSGKARAIRQEQGSRMTAEPFDNLLLARQIEGEITLSLAEQYHTDALTFPAVGDGRAQYISVNQPDPSDPSGQTKLNDIAARKAAFVIGEAPWQQGMAEAAFEAAMEMMGQLASVAPNVVVSILDIVFEMHPTLPKKATILKRIRSVTGAEDPAQGESAEATAAKQRKEQQAQLEYQAQMAQMQAAIKEAQAKGEKLDAEAMGARLLALRNAAEAAALLTQAPEIAPVADELARSVGFKDQAGDVVIGGPVDTVAPQDPAGGMPEQSPAQPAME